MKTITQKIVSATVADSQKQPPPPAVNELLKRPQELDGKTYKIKTPQSEHAMYVTINDILVDGKRRSFEIFINSKSMDNFAWIVALTRTMSAVFRHGGDVSFLVDELRSVFDPRGGYFKPGGKWMPSLIAEIGDVLERHLNGIGMMRKEDMVLPEKVTAAIGAGIVPSGPPCPHCQASMILLDGCYTCTSCGYSKCG